MAGAMLRMKPEEQKRIDKLAKKMNLRRLEKNQKVLMDTTIIHELLDMALESADVDEFGNLYYRK